MADALASGASVRKDVGVQVPPRAQLVMRLTNYSVCIWQLRQHNKSFSLSLSERL